MKMRFKILFVLLLVSTVLFNSGCMGEDFTADQIAEKMQEKQAGIEDMSATVHMTMTNEAGTQEMEYETLQKMPDKTKSVVVYPEEMAGQVTVSDGEKMWIYYPDANKVTIMTMPEISDDFEVDYTSIIGDLLNETDASLVGTENVDGRDTFILMLVPKDEEDSLYASDMKVWVDDETWTPLKIEMGTEDTYQITVEYRNFEINTGISDDEFEFEIPEGAEVTEIDNFDDMLPVSMTLEEAQNLSDYEITTPSYLPVGYELNNVMFSNTSISADIDESVTLMYSYDDNGIIITEIFYNGEIDQNSIMLESETVSVNGEEADLYSMYDNSLMLQWKHDNAILTLSASLDRNEIIQIAESME
jgi:outer membrane lipoprotein-sorting protein